MRKMILAAGLAVFAGLFGGAEAAVAGPVENACMSSGRSGASRALCRCIDNVAQQTLNRREQRMAASFFKDPQKAQDVRMSKKDSDNEFWRKYRSFGESASAYCSVAG